MADDEFRAFVETRYAPMLRTAYLLTGSHHDAEDLLQSALLRAMPRWRTMAAPEAYVRRTMVNHLISRWRKRAIIEVLSSALPERPGPPDEPEVRHELWRTLQTLPPRMRAVLVLRYWEDLSEQQTAEILGCSVGAVKSQASRGLARMRELVEPGVTGVPAAIVTRS